MRQGVNSDDGQSQDALFETLARLAHASGNTRSDWDGLTVYRYTEPPSPQCQRLDALALGVVLQGSLSLWPDGEEVVAKASSYVVMPRGFFFKSEVQAPFLALLLRLPAVTVNHVVATMRQRFGEGDRSPPAQRSLVTPGVLDDELLSALARFVRSLDTEADRSMLAPIYLQEIVYRLLRGEHGMAVAEAAQREAEGNPVTVAIRHIQANLRQQYSVSQLAALVGMSVSSFSRLFKATTGQSPYQYIKQARLDRAVECLVEEGMPVGDTAAEVGYASLSHFINEFKRYFGVTPGQFSQAQREAFTNPAVGGERP